MASPYEAFLYYSKKFANPRHLEDQSNDQTRVVQSQVDSALARWDDADNILKAAEATLSDRQYEIEIKRIEFEIGVDLWLAKKKRELIAGVFKAVVGMYETRACDRILLTILL